MKGLAAWLPWLVAVSALAGCLKAAEPPYQVEAPSWKAGYSWTYEYSSGPSPIRFEVVNTTLVDQHGDRVWLLAREFQDGSQRRELIAVRQRDLGDLGEVLDRTLSPCETPGCGGMLSLQGRALESFPDFPWKSGREWSDEVGNQLDIKWKMDRPTDLEGIFRIHAGNDYDADDVMRHRELVYDYSSTARNLVRSEIHGWLYQGEHFKWQLAPLQRAEADEPLIVTLSDSRFRAGPERSFEEARHYLKTGSWQSGTPPPESSRILVHSDFASGASAPYAPVFSAIPLEGFHPLSDDVVAWQLHDARGGLVASGGGPSWKAPPLDSGIYQVQAILWASSGELRAQAISTFGVQGSPDRATYECPSASAASVTGLCASKEIMVPPFADGFRAVVQYEAMGDMVPHCRLLDPSGAIMAEGDAEPGAAWVAQVDDDAALAAGGTWRVEVEWIAALQSTILVSSSIHLMDRPSVAVFSTTPNEDDGPPEDAGPWGTGPAITNISEIWYADVVKGQPGNFTLLVPFFDGEGNAVNHWMLVDSAGVTVKEGPGEWLNVTLSDPGTYFVRTSQQRGSAVPSATDVARLGVEGRPVHEITACSLQTDGRCQGTVSIELVSGASAIEITVEATSDHMALPGANESLLRLTDPNGMTVSETRRSDRLQGNGRAMHDLVYRIPIEAPAGTWTAEFQGTFVAPPSVHWTIEQPLNPWRVPWPEFPDGWKYG